MPSKPEKNQKELYLRTDLSAEDNERLSKELKANPTLFRELLQYESSEDQAYSDRLLFGNSNLSDQEALDGKIRKYLLLDPTLAEEEIAELEDLMLDDEGYFERMSLIETELIEDHLSGALTKDEENRFKIFFPVTPERREKLENIKALTPHLASAQSEPDEQMQPVFVPKSSSMWQSLISLMRSPNLLSGAAAGSVLLFLAIGALWWFNRSAERQNSFIVTAPTNQSAQNPNQSNASDQTENRLETVDASPTITTPQPTNANSPQPTKLPPGNQERKQAENPKPAPVVKPPVDTRRSVVFALFSGVSRGGSSAAEKKIETGAKFVDLQLRLDLEREYEDYRVVVQDSDGNIIERREKLKATKNGGLPTVGVKLPAGRFKPDDYTAVLSAKTNGEYAEAARYSFRVLK